MTFPRGDRLSSAGCALSFVGGDSCLLLTPPQMAEPKPGPEQIWLHPFLLWSICALEMTAMALKLSPVPPPPRLAPHQWQGQRSLCVVGFVWAKEPRPNPLASLASPWHKAMGTLGEDSSILLAHSLLSWSPGTLTHPRKCTGAFVSSLYFSLRLLRLAEKQEKHHSLCQKVPQMNIFYLVPVFVIYSFIFPCSQKETFLRLPYLVLFYFKWESLSIKGRGKSPSVPFSSKQFGPSLF